MNNLIVWNLVKQAPQEFLKKIDFGYLKGKTDINPQWRLMAMTQAFGIVGHGWTYRIVRTWSEKGGDGQVMAFAEVAVKTKYDNQWGEEFFGIGGSTIVELAKGNLKSNDEGYKMAVTDALSVAFKAVGVAADIYMGNYDGSKYLRDIDQAFVDYDALLKQVENRINIAKDKDTLNEIYSEFKGTQIQAEVKSLCIKKGESL